ncbi:MAG: TetR/AcrR family transcriptional regulator [Myxococcota bacterium]
MASPSPRARGPYAKSSETRARILDAALAVASEVGFHRASVAKIAERAGVAVGNLHYHFGSRDELLRELMESLIGELHAEVQAALPQSGSVLDREEAAFRTYLAYVHRHPGWIRLIEEVRLHQPDLYQQGLALWLAMFREGLEEAIARGEIQPMSEAEIAALAHVLLGTRYFLDQLIAGVDGRPYPGDELVVRTYLGFVRGGLTKQETP